MRVVDKDISSKTKRMGQFLTPLNIVKFCLDKINIKDGYVIEPSCGKGVFLDEIRKRVSPKTNVLGIEIDEKLAKEYSGNEKVIVKNFYDFNETITHDCSFVGNPPFRTPASSLTTHTDLIRQLTAKYDVSGVKEEAVFFMLKTIDLILSNKVNGNIHYILPKSIFQNNSKGYTSFIGFLKKYVQLLRVWDISDFPMVDQKLVFVSMKVAPSQETKFLYNGEKTSIEYFYGNNTDYIPFQQIFKKTYLGSVPCESLFMSIADEPVEHFQQRLSLLFDPAAIVTAETLVSMLSYNDKQHVRSLRTGNQEKIEKLLDYINQTKKLNGFNHVLFRQSENYKLIKHRAETRFYFRHNFLKKAKFIYILNSNPCHSFYFPGNPSANSTDYFGFCEYDVNRNSGPGANRCVPISGLEDNLICNFKKYWNVHTGYRPYTDIFSYILFISQSEWYKTMKKTYHRFYFGVPVKFDASFKTK